MVVAADYGHNTFSYLMLFTFLCISRDKIWHFVILIMALFYFVLSVTLKI